MFESLSIGDIVISLQGHDKSVVYIVVDFDNKGYAKLIDGEYKKIGCPKLKNPKHLKKISHCDIIIQNLNRNIITNAELYKILKNISRGVFNVKR